MNKFVGTAITGIATCCCISMANAEEGYVEFKQLVRAVNIGDSVTPNIVPRLIIPFFSVTNDANSRPTKMAFRFDLYDPTSATPTAKLFSTKQVIVTYPAMPCTNPTNVEYDYRPKFFGSWGSGRSAVVMNLYFKCTESGTGEFKENYKTFVYNVQLANNTQTPWTKVFNGLLLAADAIDLTDGSGAFGMQDGMNETLMLSMMDPAGMRMVLLDWKTGALFSNPAITMPSNKVFNIGNP